MTARRAVIGLLLLAAALQGTTVALADPGAGLFIWKLAAWGYLPHALVGIAAFLSRAHARLWPALAAMCAADIGAFLSVFVWPSDAQAPLILLVMPLWNFFVVLPAALTIRALGQRALEAAARRRATR